MELTVKIRCRQRSEASWRTLSRLIYDNNCNCSKLKPINEGFLAFLNSDEDLNRIVKSEITERFKDNGFEVVIPYTLLCKKTVIAWNIDAEIFKINEDEMLQELMSCNAGLEIIQLTKFNNARNFKFVCKEAYMANNCLNHGIRMFDMSFPARMLSAQKPKGNNLQRPTFCFRCYAINDHSVRDCPKPPEFTICSECSSTNHSWQNCTSTTKKCLNCSGEHRTMSNTCPSVKEASTKKTMQNNNISQASSSSYSGSSNRAHTEPTRNSSSHIGSSSRSYADATRQSSILSSAANYISYKDSFKGYMCLLYASQHNQSIPGTFQDVFHYLLKINSLPDFVLGDAPALAPINPCADSMHGSSTDPPALHQRTSASNSSTHNEVCQPPPLPEIPNASTTISNPHSESNNTPFHGNSETHAAVNPAASETSETPAAHIDLAVSSLLTHVRNSVQTENSPSPNQISQSSHSPNADPHRSIEVSVQQTPTSSQQLDDQNQISQSSHPPNTDLDRSIEVTLQQTAASSLQLDDQNSSNAANDTFHSVGEEPSPRPQQLVPPIALETTKFETPTNEASSADVHEDELIARREETLTSVSPQNQSTPISQPRLVKKGKTKKSRKCTIFVDKNNGHQILSTNSIVNLKNKKLIAIEHVCEHPQSITCMDKLADAQKNQNFNEYNVQLATTRVFEKKWEMLNFDEDHLLSS